MTLKELYEDIQRDPQIDWGQIQYDLAELADSKYFPALKTLIGGVVGDLLTQAEDITKVHDGQMSLEAYGTRAYIARSAADKIQSIIDLIERTHDVLGGNEDAAR